MVIGEEIVKMVVDHYAHACEKHPYFADFLLDENRMVLGRPCEKVNRRHLAAVQKEWLRKDAMNRNVTPEKVLLCEVAEVNDAVSIEDYKQAEYEIFDCIAVLLRWLEMIRDARKGEAAHD